MSAIEHAMSLVGANREDMIYMARSCVVSMPWTRTTTQWSLASNWRGKTPSS